MHTPTPGSPPPLTDRVSAELRAEIARQRITTTSLAARLGRPRSWLDRRLSGSVLTVDDVHAISKQLGLDARVVLERADA